MLDSSLSGDFILLPRRKRMLKIGEFSKLCKTTIKTLRYYDEVGLLKPVKVDTNGYRYYEVEQLNDLIFILELRKLDISILDIKNIQTSDQKQKFLENHLLHLKEEMHRKNNQISLIKNLIEKSKKGEIMEKYFAKKVVVPKNIVYYKHGTIDSMADLFDFVLQAGAEVKQYNPHLQCKNYCYVTYSANEYKEKDIELEYVEAVEAFGKESENIKFREEDEIVAISVIHKGSYENLNKAYAFAINWVKEKGYKIVAPIREVYIDGCWNKDSVNDYLTEIQVPISIK